jgi:hypothetical protein
LSFPSVADVDATFSERMPVPAGGSGHAGDAGRSFARRQMPLVVQPFENVADRLQLRRRKP